MRDHLKVLCVLALMLTALPAMAQMRGLKNSTVTIEREFGPEQTREVTTYVDEAIKLLRTGDTLKITSARAQLTEPLFRGGSRFFNTAYSSIATTRLALLLSDRSMQDKDIVRINILIAADKMSDPSVLQLIELGLTDENAGVRYWAAKCALGPEPSDTLAQELYPQNDEESLAARAEVEQRLLQAFTKAAEKETEEWVIQVMTNVLVSLSTPDAAPIAVGLLEKRLAKRLATKQTGDIALEELGIRRVLNKIIRLRTRGNPVADDPFLRRSAALYYRYGSLAAAQLALEELDPTLSAEDRGAYSELRNTAHQAVDYMVKQLDQSVARPADALAGMRASKVNEIFASDWPKALKAVGLTDKQLYGN